jgi:phenylalanyl-tRNA synthetase alpha chain
MIDTLFTTDWLDKLSEEEKIAIQQAETVEALDACRVQWLGKKGTLTQQLKQLKNLPDEQRRELGAASNALQQALALAIDERREALAFLKYQAQIAAETIDVTMPGVPARVGASHPLTLVTEQLVTCLSGLGFSMLPEKFSPEVETEYYNFDALNFPAHHPARDMQDTFYTDVADHVILRSQTSNAQIRWMEKQQPPIRVISPGRVYRNENVSSKKHVLFHQLEGLWVEEGIALPHLKGVLTAFVTRFFGGARQMRFRNSYFPFTEPSLEIDIWSEERGWLEILGAGMVDPNVLAAVNIDAERYTGFAFGVGVERMAMLKYGIADIRWFYENDVRFLSAFRGVY